MYKIYFTLDFIESKYKVLNSNKVIGTDSYNAQNSGIDIVFESERASSETISCNNYCFAARNSTTLNESYTGNNGDYINKVTSSKMIYKVIYRKINY